MIGKMPRDEIAAEIGTSLANLKRAFRGTRLAFYNYCIINPNLVRDVNRFYEKNGLIRTAEHFALKRKQVEHIIYRYKQHRPRQTRWTEAQFIELARMGGLVTYTGQARFFKRPNANEGSIKSAWMKKFGVAGGSINGMSNYMARELVTKDCPYVLTRFLEKRKPSGKYGRKLFLWVDMEKHLKPDVPGFIREAIVTLAKFQRWLHGSANPKQKILRTIEARECHQIST